MSQKTIAEIITLYGFREEDVTCKPYGDGHINETYLVTEQENGGENLYILQKLSQVAFQEPEKVMENVSKVSAFLRQSILMRGGNPDRETLTIVPMVDGREYLMTDDGCWRMYLFVTDSVTFQQAGSEEVFRQAGRAFGSFMRDLGDYPAATLHEVIPHFHDTPRRVEALREAIAADQAHRADTVQEEIAFALARAERAKTLVQGMEEGKLPLRVTHNDTKLNNVLMDAKTHEGLCVIDLDTVMPGLCAYDFGDAIRFGANTAAEDEKDLTKIHFSMPLFRAYCEGYLGEAAGMLSREEIASLPMGAWMMTYECGIRFLTDYLNGDVYFRTAYADHNLVRARDQFALLSDMERQEADMAACVREWMEEE